MLATDKSRYFAQPRPIIVNYYYYRNKNILNNYLHMTIYIWHDYKTLQMGLYVLICEEDKIDELLGYLG